MTDSDIFRERVLQARDVCRNCFSLVRVERIDPTRGGVAREFESHYERHRQTTTVDYAPAERVSEQKGVFCECGVEEPRTRVWSEEDVDDERFRELVQSMLRTLEAKDITVARETAAAHALQARRGGADVDEALATGLVAGVSVAVAQPST